MLAKGTSSTPITTGRRRRTCRQTSVQVCSFTCPKGTQLFLPRPKGTRVSHPSLTQGKPSVYHFRAVALRQSPFGPARQTSQTIYALLALRPEFQSSPFPLSHFPLSPFPILRTGYLPRRQEFPNLVFYHASTSRHINLPRH
jgi:hypothetical protein